MNDFLRAALEILSPPKTLAGKEGLRWAYTITVAIISVGALQVLQLLLIWGWLPLIFVGFPTQGTIAQQLLLSEKKMEDSFHTTTNGLELLIVEQRLHDLRDRQCQDIKNDNHQAAEAQGSIIEQLKVRYFMLTGVPYDERPCTEF